MTRSGALLCLLIACVAAGCNRGPTAPTSPPTGVEMFAAGRVSMTFIGQDQSFTTAVEQYQRLWVDEGPAIVDAMERVSGLSFRETNIRAVIFEGVSRSGAGDVPMYLRASYPADVKKSTLVHEHGHRLIAQLTNRPGDLDEHRVLFLFLYDVWESLWGRAFADEHVRIESGRTGVYDYATAWRWALSLTREQRAARFAAIVQSNRR
jgi:hypothetical protein